MLAPGIIAVGFLRLLGQPSLKMNLKDYLATLDVRLCVTSRMSMLTLNI